MKRERWTCVSLNKKQIYFLDEISKNCKFSGGRKLCRTSIIRAFLRVAKKLDIDISGIKSEAELKERMLTSFRAQV
jgi:hypothetical protein